MNIHLLNMFLIAMVAALATGIGLGAFMESTLVRPLYVRPSYQLMLTLGLGVIGRERFHFWGLLVWTSLRRPTLMPMAVTLSIYGFHFRKCCEALAE